MQKLAPLLVLTFLLPATGCISRRIQNGPEQCKARTQRDGSSEMVVVKSYKTVGLYPYVWARAREEERLSSGTAEDTFVWAPLGRFFVLTVANTITVGIPTWMHLAGASDCMWSLAGSCCCAETAQRVAACPATPLASQ